MSVKQRGRGRPYVFRATIKVEVTQQFVALAASRELTPEVLTQILCDAACREPTRSAIINPEPAKFICLPSCK